MPYPAGRLRPSYSLRDRLVVVVLAAIASILVIWPLTGTWTSALGAGTGTAIAMFVFYSRTRRR